MMNTYHAAINDPDRLDRLPHTAAFHGWLVARYRPADAGMGWRKPVRGYPGRPALLFARRCRALRAERKPAAGRLRPEQRRWFAELDDHGRLWRSGDWPAVRAELSGEVDE